MVLGLILMCLLLAMGILVSVVVMGQKQKEIDRLNEEIIQLQQQIDGQKGFAFY